MKEKCAETKTNRRKKKEETQKSWSVFEIRASKGKLQDDVKPRDQIEEEVELENQRKGPKLGKGGE